MSTNILQHKNTHLAFSSFIVIIVAFGYGLSPNYLLPIFFDFKVESIDLNNVFRAIMGLYLSLAVFWIIGILKHDYWRSATIVCTLFMGGLAIGRTISMLIDGMPSTVFAVGTILEFLFMFWGIRNLKTYKLQ
jgi:hypothetical protein